MSKSTIVSITDKITEIAFQALFFLTPLLVTPFTHELFEFPKMMFVYFCAGIILIAQAVKAFAGRHPGARSLSDEAIGSSMSPSEQLRAGGRISPERSEGSQSSRSRNALGMTNSAPQFLDSSIPKSLTIAVAIFLAANLLSSAFSLHKPTSFFGYYTRFNGGFLSLLSYAVIFFAFLSHVNNLYKSEAASATPQPKNPEEKSSSFKPTPFVFMYRYIDTLLFSSLLVSLYGIAQRFGVDKSYWVQNSQARVFSTLGQPNWLATYLAMLFPLSVAMMILAEDQRRKVYYLFVSAANFACFWFTYSLSGMLGLGAALAVFAFLTNRRVGALHATPLHRRYLEILGAICLLIMILFPGTFLIRLKDTFHGIQRKLSTTVLAAEESLEAGPGNTANIRLLVWRASLKIVRDHPLLGTGPETFAYALLPYRPKELNKTTEWAFVYNKAHNEYLNIAACTGILGLAAYILLSATFLKYQRSNIKDQKDIPSNLLTIALLAGWVGSLVSNFFGFSVVCTNLLFWLFPAIAILLSPTKKEPIKPIPSTTYHLLPTTSLLLGLTLIVTAVTQLTADAYFAKGETYEHLGLYETAAKYFSKAAEIFPFEQAYLRELAFSLAKISKEEDSSTIGKADKKASRTFAMNPLNVLTLKSLTRTYYLLGSVDERFWKKAIAVAKYTANLSPTDPQASYNLATIFYAANKDKKALEELKRTLDLKPDYPEAQKLKSAL